MQDSWQAYLFITVSAINDCIPVFAKISPASRTIVTSLVPMNAAWERGYIVT